MKLASITRKLPGAAAFAALTMQCACLNWLGTIAGKQFLLGTGVTHVPSVMGLFVVLTLATLLRGVPGLFTFFESTHQAQ